jgi:hypothetical protein
MKPSDRLLSAYEMELLGIFATNAGRTWRSRLRKIWESGRYDGFDPESAQVFQSIRNKVGPSGLDRIRFPDPPG